MLPLERCRWLIRGRASLGLAALGLAALGLAGTLLGFPSLQKGNAVFVHETELNHPIEVVWHALTRKAQVDRYYLAPLGADITSAGAEIFYGLPAQKLITGRVMQWVAPRRLVHTFQFAGDTAAESVVTYALTPSGTGTRLRIEHQGYAVDSQPYADIAMGWPIIVDRLGVLLDGRK